MTLWALLASFALFCANGFFVATEFSLIASRRPKLEPLAEEGNRRARLALASMSDLPTQMAGCQLGNTGSSIILGFLAEPSVAHLLELALDGLLPESALHTVSFIIALILVSCLHMLIGEMVPKNLALAGPERVAMTLAPIHRVFVAMFRPLIWVLNLLSVAIVEKLGYHATEEIGSAYTAQEFSSMVAASHQKGVIEEFDHLLLTGALDFGEQTVSSVAIARSQVQTVNRQMTVADIEQVVVSSGHSRLPVLGTGFDDVLGYVHAKDLLRLPVEDRDAPVPLELIRRMLKVSLDRKLEDLLLQMRKSRLHFAVVQDASRRTVGIVTLEDVLEELVGDIRDESDREPSR